jgi:hypothetical protein
MHPKRRPKQSGILCIFRFASASPHTPNELVGLCLPLHNLAAIVRLDILFTSPLCAGSSAAGPSPLPHFAVLNLSISAISLNFRTATHLQPLPQASCPQQLLDGRHDLLLVHDLAAPVLAVRIGARPARLSQPNTRKAAAAAMSLGRYALRLARSQVPTHGAVLHRAAGCPPHEGAHLRLA